MKKGFTLIELLAVIIILAIVLTIAIPIITKITDNTAEKAFLDNSYFIMSSARIFSAEKQLSSNSNEDYLFTFEKNQQISDYDEAFLDFTGTIPDSGSIVVTRDQKIGLAFWSEKLNKCAYKDYDINKIIFDDSLNKDTCYFYDNSVRSVWFWANYNLNYEMQYITDKNYRESVLNKLAEIGINTIYLTMEPGQILNVYKEFIAYANLKNIKVYYLLGDPTSILPEKEAISITVPMDEVAAFNNEMINQGSSTKIEGLHYDVEFYGQGNTDFGLGLWINGQSETAKRGARRLAYINFAKKALIAARARSLKIEYDVTQEVGKFTYYDEQDSEKNMLEEILKNSDRISLMYYTTMKKYITTNNQLTATGIYTFPHEEGSPDSSVDITVSIIDYINQYHNSYSIGKELSFFRKDAMKVETCKESFVNELVPTYIDQGLAFTPSYIRSYNDLERKTIKQYQDNNGMNSEVGLSYHDVWELLYLYGYETQVSTNRISNFNNELNSNPNCVE